MRLFAALALSPAAVERLSALRLRLAVPGDGLRWTVPEQWHITLCFFGDLERKQVECLTQDLQAFDAPEASISLGALGHFAAKGILYASVEPSTSLLSLHQTLLSRYSRGAQTSAPSLPFHPHITLARSKGRPGFKTLQRMSSPTLPPFGPAITWQARQVALYESCLGLGGAQYRFVAGTPSAEAWA